MPEKRWQETVADMVQVDIARAKEVMKGVIYRPVRRQAPIRQQVVAAVTAPESLPADGRARLMQQLYAKYGEQARNVIPYITGEPAMMEGPDPLQGLQ